MFEENKQNSNDSGVFLSLGGKVDKATVTLRIFGDDLDPEELTELLKCNPTEAYKKGHIITTTIRPRTIKTGMWFLSIEKSSEQTLEEQISELFEKLTGDLEIWETLGNRFETSIYCGAWLKGWNRDVWFTSNLLKQIADRHLSIGLAIYCDCEDEEE